MEEQIVCNMVQYLLNHRFASKKALADGFGIPYRKLLNVCESRADRKTTILVTRGLLHGCMAYHIPIEDAIDIS